MGAPEASLPEKSPHVPPNAAKSDGEGAATRPRGGGGRPSRRHRAWFLRTETPFEASDRPPSDSPYTRCLHLEFSARRTVLHVLIASPSRAASRGPRSECVAVRTPRRSVR